jgi:hypothetical protein
MLIATMRQTLIIFMVISFVTSCSNRTRQVNNGQETATDTRNVNSGLSGSVEKREFLPDTTIGQISLMNSKNVDEYLGSDVMDRLVDEGIISSSLVSNDKKQQLTFYFHPGGTKKEFSEFKVSYIDKPDSKIRISSDKEFMTESKIKLGITIDNFKAIKGEPDSISNNEKTTFHYKIDDFENSKFLRKYNMPSYYGTYKFDNGYLTEFSFGFEYP